jgi:hypothetical protein
MQFINVNNIPLYNNLKNNKEIIVKTSKSIYEIENSINNILDKYNEKCKYYIDINNSYYSVSFNVQINQLQGMIDTMLYIYIYKTNDNLSIIKIVDEKEEHPEFKIIKNDLVKVLS